MRLFKRLFYYGYSIVKIILHIRNWLSLVPLFFCKPKSDEKMVRLRRPPLRLIVRGAMDVWAIKETFLDRFYSRYGVPVQDGWRVIDIGAGIGDFSIHAAYGNPKAVIYAYEPFPNSYQLLIRNLTLNAIDNVMVFQKAVWCSDGELVLDLSKGEPLQIASKNFSLGVGNSDTVTVQAVSLQTVLDGQGIDRVDLLKLDCEGAEYEILMKASSSTLERIERIIMEYHDVDSAHNHQRLIRFLQEQGYQVTRYENFVHDDIGYVYAVRV